MKTVAWAILVLMLACASGCTHPDWIERTLVTVDVTGVWHGSLQGPPWTTGSQVWLDLRQDGPKANGSMRAQGAPAIFGTGGAISGPIEGAIAGDAFNFRLTNGAMKGDLTVSGDEMTGQVSIATSGAVHTQYAILLRRVESSPRPSSPKP